MQGTHKVRPAAGSFKVYAANNAGMMHASSGSPLVLSSTTINY